MGDTEHITLGAAAGLDQRWRAGENSAKQCKNLTWDPRGGWRTAGGYRRILRGQPNQAGVYIDPFTNIGKIWSLHKFSQGNGARSFLLFEADGGSSNPTTATLYMLNPSTRTNTPYTVLRDRGNNALTGRTVVTTPWQRTQSCTWKDRIYLINGIDMPVVFDGYQADRAGFDMYPGAPNAQEITSTTATYYASSTGNGRIPGLGIGPVPPDETTSYDWVGRFRVTFINSRGEESPPSPASEMVRMRTGSSAITSGRNFVWLNIPVGGDNVVARRIYRTQNTVDSAGNAVSGRADQYFFQQTIEDNVTKGFEVFLDDDELGSQLDPYAFGLWPAGAKYLASFKETMFLAGMNESEVVYSAPGSPEVFPLLNRLDVGDAHLGPITGLYATRNAVIVTKARAVYLIKGDPLNGFYVQTLSQDVGSLSPRAIVEIPNVGLAMVAQDGIYVLQGTLENEGTQTKVVHLSTPLYEATRSWNTAALLNAVAVPNYADKEVLFFIPTLGETDPTMAWVYHYEIGQWSTREDIPVSCALNTNDHRNYVFFGSHDSATHPGIHVYSRGWDDLDGDDLVPVYETCDIDFNRIFRDVSPLTVFVYGIGYGDNDLTLDYSTARRTGYVRAAAGSSELSTDQQYPEAQNRMPVYGATAGDFRSPDRTNEVAIWGTSVWSQWRPIVLRYDISTTHVNPCHELAVRLQPQTDTFQMQIIEISVELRPGDLIKKKPLSTLLGATGR